MESWLNEETAEKIRKEISDWPSWKFEAYDEICGKEQYSSKDIIDLLKKRFSNPREYSYATEVGNSTGLSQTRRLDFCVINHFESKDFAIEGIEVKVSKLDLLNELRNPQKHNIFFKNINYYSLACPKNIVDKNVKELLPVHWGLYTVSDGKLRQAKKPIPLQDMKIDKIDKSFVSAFIRRIAQPKEAELNSMLNEEYHKGYEKGVARQKEIEEQTRQLMESGRKKDYADCYRELLDILDTQHYKLRDAIPVIRMILSTDTGFLKSYLEDTIQNLNKLNDMLGDDFEDIKKRQGDKS